MKKPTVGQIVYTELGKAKIIKKIGRIYFYIADKESYPEHMWDKLTLKNWRAGPYYNRSSFQVYESMQAIRDEERMSELRRKIKLSLFGRESYLGGELDLPLEVWEDIAGLIEPWRKQG